MARADFNMIRFDQDLTASAPSATRQFPIEGSAAPVDDAYLLVQVQGVASTHAIQINGAVLEAGGQVRYSEYRGVGHNSWVQAFSEPELLPWVFAQKRSER